MPCAPKWGQQVRERGEFILSEEITVSFFHFPFIVSRKEHGAEETVVYFS
jgi:hypothetical protein